MIRRERRREAGTGLAGMLTLFALLFCAGSPASAEWVRAGGTHKYDGYVDMATIAPTRQRVTLWTLKDFKVIRQIPKGPYHSMAVKKQFDCRAGKGRLLQTKYYMEQMGKGRAFFTTQGTRQWSRVIPGSDGETEWKIACQIAS